MLWDTTVDIKQTKNVLIIAELVIISPCLQHTLIYTESYHWITVTHSHSGKSWT